MTAALADRLRKVLETHTQRDLRADFARSDFLRDHGAELLRIVEEAERDRERLALARTALWHFANCPRAVPPLPSEHRAYAERILREIDAARGHGGG